MQRQHYKYRNREEESSTAPHTTVRAAGYHGDRWWLGIFNCGWWFHIGWRRWLVEARRKSYTMPHFDLECHSIQALTPIISIREIVLLALEGQWNSDCHCFTKFIAATLILKCVIIWSIIRGAVLIGGCIVCLNNCLVGVCIKHQSVTKIKVCLAAQAE